MNVPEHNSVRAVRNNLLKKLAGLYPEKEAWAIADEVFLRLLSFRPDQRVLFANNSLDEEAVNIISEAGKRLAEGMPVQYVTGVCTFFDCELSVSKDVLIPRKETEELVTHAREILTSYCENTGKPLPELKILDIGTGSGCIAIALSKCLGGEAVVAACDISEQAVEVAKHNALKNNVNVNFFLYDILSDPLSDFSAGSLDCIISNPPYVRHSEKKMMHKNVLDYEPSNALFVSDENPLAYYNIIANTAYKKLCQGGLLLFEINEYLGDKIVYMLEKKDYKEVQLKQDFNNRDRFVFAVK